MAIELVFVLVVIGLAVGIGLAVSTSNQVKQLRRELDDTQRQLNELKAAADVVPAPPPPLPRTSRARSGTLDDLRQQLRAAHRDPQESSEEYRRRSGWPEPPCLLYTSDAADE